MHLFLKCLALLLVIVAEDGTSELLHLADNIPRLVVADALHDILQYPLQHHIGMGEIVNQTVDGLFFYLYVIQTNTQVGSKVEFASQIA